jgi:cell division protein FtsB
MRLPQFRELERRLQALAAENRKLRENNSVLKEQVELFKSVEK